nr:hypothetical protein [uncultured Campylobacter sp.]
MFSGFKFSAYLPKLAPFARLLTLNFTAVRLFFTALALPLFSCEIWVKFILL